jgi:hypothetical protein
MQHMVAVDFELQSASGLSSAGTSPPAGLKEKWTGRLFDLSVERNHLTT